MSPKRKPVFTTGTYWVLGLLLLNAVAVDAYIVSRFIAKKDVLGESTETACPQACLTKLNQITGKSVSTSAVKEYYVPLGSGSGAADEWTDVAGAGATIDTASYGRIKQVTFEVTTAIPTGGQRIWVRLFNATDKHPVWYSEMTTDSSGPVLLTTKAVSLDQGSKTYQVQMKTQLRVLTNLVQSRVRIITY